MAGPFLFGNRLAGSGFRVRATKWKSYGHIYVAQSGIIG
jgi:hypothetical protein